MLGAAHHRARQALPQPSASALDNCKRQTAVASQGKDALASQVAVCFSGLIVIKGKPLPNTNLRRSTMDNFVEITLDQYGFTFASGPIYLNLQWVTVVVIIAITTGYKVYKAIKRKNEQDEFYAV